MKKIASFWWLYFYTKQTTKLCVSLSAKKSIMCVCVCVTHLCRWTNIYNQPPSFSLSLCLYLWYWISSYFFTQGAFTISCFYSKILCRRRWHCNIWGQYLSTLKNTQIKPQKQKNLLKKQNQICVVKSYIISEIEIHFWNRNKYVLYVFVYIF